MLRILSSKIFREDLNEFALPMWAFENFEDVEKLEELYSGTYKFCLPVSIGDFNETNVPACFSSDVEELRKFVSEQKNKNDRRAFIISDFQVNNLDNLLFSGVISTSQIKGESNYLEQSTTISMTFKNPIKTYAIEGVSPRDLPADIQLTYDHVHSENHAFPKIDIKKEGLDLKNIRHLIYQSFKAASKIHNVSEEYDGTEYSTHTLFFVDKSHRIRLYEIIGEEAFLGKAKVDTSMLRTELDLIKDKQKNYLKYKKL